MSDAKGVLASDAGRIKEKLFHAVYGFALHVVTREAVTSAAASSRRLAATNESQEQEERLPADRALLPRLHRQRHAAACSTTPTATRGRRTFPTAEEAEEYAKNRRGWITRLVDGDGLHKRTLGWLFTPGRQDGGRRSGSRERLAGVHDCVRRCVKRGFTMP